VTRFIGVLSSFPIQTPTTSAEPDEPGIAIVLAGARLAADDIVLQRAGATGPIVDDWTCPGFVER
jgi:hypothetical protein